MKTFQRRLRLEARKSLQGGAETWGGRWEFRNKLIHRQRAGFIPSFLPSSIHSSPPSLEVGGRGDQLHPGENLKSPNSTQCKLWVWERESFRDPEVGRLTTGSFCIFAGSTAELHFSWEPFPELSRTLQNCRDRSLGPGAAAVSGRKKKKTMTLCHGAGPPEATPTA